MLNRVSCKLLFWPKLSVKSPLSAAVAVRELLWLGDSTLDGICFLLIPGPAYSTSSISFPRCSKKITCILCRPLLKYLLPDCSRLGCSPSLFTTLLSLIYSFTAVVRGSIKSIGSCGSDVNIPIKSKSKILVPLSGTKAKIGNSPGFLCL